MNKEPVVRPGQGVAPTRNSLSCRAGGLCTPGNLDAETLTVMMKVGMLEVVGKTPEPEREARERPPHSLGRSQPRPP